MNPLTIFGIVCSILTCVGSIGCYVADDKLAKEKEEKENTDRR